MLDEDTEMTPAGLCTFEDVDGLWPPVGAAGGAGGTGGGGSGGGNIMPTKFASASRTAINLVRNIEMENIVSHNAQSLTLQMDRDPLLKELLLPPASKVYNLRITINLSIWMRDPKFNFPG